MALGHGSSITLNGLIFAYDFDNEKSFKGAPTVNLLDNPIPTSNVGFTMAGNEANSDPGTNFVVYDSETSSIRWRRESYSSWGTYLYMDPIFNGTLDANVLYSFQCEWKPGDESNVALTEYRWQISQGNGSDPALGARRLLADSELQDNGWYKAEHTFTPQNTGISAYTRFIVWEDLQPQVLDFYVRNMQLEKANATTYFTSTSRGEANCLYDQTGNKSITLNGNVIIEEGNDISLSGPGGCYIDIGNFDEVTGQYTLDVWLNITQLEEDANVNDYRHVITSDNYTIFNILVEQSGQIAFRVPGVDVTNYTTTPNDIVKNEWNNITCTYDQRYRSIYLNGEFLKRQDIGPGNVALGDMRVGSLTTGSQHDFNGKIPVVKIYDRALTADEIRQNYNALKGRFR